MIHLEKAGRGVWPLLYSCRKWCGCVCCRKVSPCPKRTGHNGGVLGPRCATACPDGRWHPGWGRMRAQSGRQAASGPAAGASAMAGKNVETMLLLQMESLLCCSRRGMLRTGGPCCGWAVPSVERGTCRTA